MTYIPDADKKVIEHVRRPGLPWRESTLTECGIPRSGQPCLERAEFIAKVKAQGQQRSAMTTCMTCWDTARRHPSWDEDPVASIGREVESYRRWRSKLVEDGFRRELVAIAMLIERHRVEFDDLIEDQAAIVALPADRSRKLT